MEWRQKQGTIKSVECHPSDSYYILLERAESQLKHFMPELKVKDLTTRHGTPLHNVPGTNEPFTIELYRKKTGIRFKDLKFFIRHDDNCTTEVSLPHLQCAESNEGAQSDSPPEQILEIEQRNLLNFDSARPLRALVRSSEDIEHISSDEEAQVILDSTMMDNTMAEILEYNTKNFLSAEEIIITVYREDIIGSYQNAASRRGFSHFKTPKIEFLQESAVDDGGPKREFMLLLLRHFVHEKGIFEGRDGLLYLTYSIEHIDKKSFRNLGFVFAWSVIHGGPGLHCIMPEVVELMLNNEPHMVHRLECIPDAEFVSNVKKVLHCNEADWPKVIDQVEEFFTNFGSVNVTRWLHANKEDTVNMLIKHFIYRRNKHAYDHFIEGMQQVGKFWTLFTRFPKALQPLFVFAGGNVSYTTMKELSDFSYSIQGTNDEQAEKRTCFILHNFLLDLEAAETFGNSQENESDVSKVGSMEMEIKEAEDQISLKDFLKFLTGCNSVPPMGFKKKVTVSFFDHVLTSFSRIYPSVSTCGLTLSIPRHVVDKNVFDKYMKTAIRCGGDFFGHI